MNKKIVIVFIIIFIIIVFSLSGIIIYNNLTNYSTVLKANWNIELPKNSIKEIYSTSSTPSFHGDGIRYHIFSFNYVKFNIIKCTKIANSNKKQIK